ncbi:helix-turn-helix transcriptional regulator [Streptomyces sp. NPDC048277]|uniref:helix-turn-helix transcriptional regulator n=1 Tax=Streptomyces sp. NPDC048277 TaxID=3155027 RepID=UPI0034084C27
MHETELLGRDNEMRSLGELTGRLPAAGGALALAGGPGVGKTALLHAVAGPARAMGRQVLWTTGRTGSGPFTGLGELLRPLLGTIDVLPAAQRAVLRSVLGSEPGPPPGTFTVALAALNLLVASAARRPAVLIADDAHRLDGPTREVLAFMARRVSHDPVVVLAALRTGSTLPGTAVLEVPALNDSSARRLLNRHAHGLAPAEREQILLGARGNPLALVELPAAPSGARPAGSWAHLPVTATLATAFADALAGLSRQSRDALLVAAVDHVGELPEILAAASVLSDRSAAVDVLDGAVAGRLVRLDGTRLRFVHPVVRYTVLDAESPARRRAAHAALAAVLADEPHRRLWHQARSVDGPDDELADELAAAHSLALHRYGVVAAIWTLERSAQLTTDSAVRGNRLLGAAEYAYGLGRMHLTHDLIDQADRQRLTEADRAWAEYLRAVSDAPVRPGRTATPPVFDIAERSTSDPDHALGLLLRGALQAHRTGAGPADRAGLLAVADGLTAADDPRRIVALALIEPVSRGREVADGLPSNAAVSGLPDADGLRLLGIAAHTIGDPVRAVELLSRAEPAFRGQGRLGLLSHVLITQAGDLLLLGDWPHAARLADEARRIVARTRQSGWIAELTCVDAHAAALRGDTERALELADTVAGRQRGELAMRVRPARGVARLAAGQHAEAYAELRPLFDHMGESLHREALTAVMPFAAAANACGRRAEAAAVLADLEETARLTPAPLLHVQLPYARAVLAADAVAEELYLVALGQDLARWPLVKARTEQAYGQWLRRRRRFVEARSVLLAAQTTFELVGFADWAEQGGGQADADSLAPAEQVLSPQELRIARLAAQGLSNRQIGQRLNLSDRTIATHLYRAFPKLGVASRRDLAARLKLPDGGALAATSGIAAVR